MRESKTDGAVSVDISPEGPTELKWSIMRFMTETTTKTKVTASINLSWTLDTVLKSI